MKYWELINIPGKTSVSSKCETVSIPEGNGQVIYDNPPTTNETNKQINEEMTSDIKTILEFIEELKSKDCSAPAGFEETSLDNDQICEVLSILLEYQEKYASDTPLAETLSKSFVYNIPKEIYDTATYMRACELPDCINPLYWLYMMIMANPVDAIPRFITNSLDQFNEHYEKIVELSMNYGINYLDEVYEIPVEPSVTSLTTNDISEFDPEITQIDNEEEDDNITTIEDASSVDLDSFIENTKED